MSTLTVSAAAWSTQWTGVQVTFNQNVDSVDAATTTNYSIPGLTISAASYNATTFVTTLTVSGSTHPFGTSYTVTVTGVRDSGHTQTIASPNNGAAFMVGAMGAPGTDNSFAVSKIQGIQQRSTQTRVASSTPFTAPGTATPRAPDANFNVGFN